MEIFMIIIISIVIFVLLMLALRAVIVWYFKIDVLIDLLTKQLNNQRSILKHLRGEPVEEKKE